MTATRHTARGCFFTCVSVDVIAEKSVGSKGSVAQVTLVWSLIGVDLGRE